MILEVVPERDDYEIDGLYLHAQETGKDQIKGFELVKVLENSKKSENPRKCG